jgi:4-amino-4-deoxy-L-arabinose transferase-like glycosyltransferase
MTWPRATGAAVPIVLLGLLAVVAVATMANLGQLGYDEAIYASKARSYVSDVTVDWWRPYRPPGIAVAGTLAGVVGFSDLAVRAVTLAGGLATLALVWLVTRQLWDSRAALFALLGAMGAPVVLGQLPLFHNDVASAGLLLLLMWILWDQFETRPTPTRMLLLAPAVAAAAFYTRYGIVAGILGIGLTVPLLWARRLLAHARLVGATALVGVVLLLPHLAYAVSATGSPLGVLAAARNVADSTEPSVSLRSYVSWIRPRLFGPVPVVLAAAGVGSAVAAAIGFALRRQGADHLRRQLWLLLPAAIAAGITVMVSHAEARYLMFPVMLLIISGGGALSVAISLLVGAPPLAGRVAALPILCTVVVAIVLAGYAGAAAIRQLRDADGRPTAWQTAGKRIAADADGPCRVIAAVRPQIGWYTRCKILRMNEQTADAVRADGPTTYVVFGDEAALRPDVAAKYRDLVEGAVRLPPEGEGGDEYEIYRLGP